MGGRASGGATAIGTAVKNSAARHVNTSHSLTNLQARRGFLIELVRLLAIGSRPRDQPSDLARSVTACVPCGAPAHAARWEWELRCCRYQHTRAPTEEL
jgi:hypothetical protein